MTGIDCFQQHINSFHMKTGTRQIEKSIKPMTLVVNGEFMVSVVHTSHRRSTFSKYLMKMRTGIIRSDQSGKFLMPSLYFILDFVNLEHAIFKLFSLVIRSMIIRDRTFIKGGGANMGRVIIFCVT